MKSKEMNDAVLEMAKTFSAFWPKAVTNTLSHYTDAKSVPRMVEDYREAKKRGDASSLGYTLSGDVWDDQRDINTVGIIPNSKNRYLREIPSANDSISLGNLCINQALETLTEQYHQSMKGYRHIAGENWVTKISGSKEFRVKITEETAQMLEIIHEGLNALGVINPRSVSPELKYIFDELKPIVKSVETPKETQHPRKRLDGAAVEGRNSGPDLFYLENHGLMVY